jgi:hypothetical protein
LPPCAELSSASSLDANSAQRHCVPASLVENLAGRSLVAVGCAPPAILSRSIDFESGGAAEPWGAAQQVFRNFSALMGFANKAPCTKRSRDRAPSRSPTKSRYRRRRCASHRNWRDRGSCGRSIASIDLRRRRQISGRPPVFAVAAEIRQRRRAWAVPPRSPAAPAAGRSRWFRDLRGS